MSRLIRMTVAVLVVSTAGLALVAAAAQAKVVTSTTTLENANDTGTAIATCPSSQLATGGGFVSDDTSFLEAGLTVYASHKVGQHAWGVSAQSFASFGFPGSYSPQTLTAEAVCSKRAKPTGVRRAVATTGATAGAYPATARCKHGQTAQAGGWAAPVPGSSMATFTEAGSLASFRPSKSAWKGVEVSYDDGYPNQRMSVFAYCAKTTAPKTETGTVQVTSAQALTYVTVQSNPCPRRTRLLSSGYRQGSPAEGSLQLSRLAPLGRATSVHAFSGVGAGTDELQAFAYCTKPARHHRH